LRFRGPEENEIDIVLLREFNEKFVPLTFERMAQRAFRGVCRRCPARLRRGALRDGKIRQLRSGGGDHREDGKDTGYDSVLVER
jgi:hypothetical protein